MRRSPLIAAPLVAALIGLAGCGAPESTTDDAGAAPSSSADAGAPSGAEGAVPELSGDPTDLTQPTQAGPGAGDPPTELVVSDVVVGEGPPATTADTVLVQYTGTFWTDGEVFDSSWERGEPAEFPLNGVIDGFSQGIEGMAPGGRRVLVVPPDLGYGDQDQPGLPGGSTLVFVVDLVSIA